MLTAAWDWYYGTSSYGNILDNCELDEPLPSTGPDVSIQLGKLENGADVTVFSSLKSEPNQLTSVDVCAKRLRILRHPNILRYVGVESTDHASFLVTEHVAPLKLRYEMADANEICSGLNDIANALLFMHDKAGISHNCLTIDNIFVTTRGEWKISGMQFSCPFAEANLELIREVRRPQSIIPPEEAKNNIGDPKKYGYCRDVYAFGVLLKKFQDEVRFSSQISQKFLDDLIEEILQEDFTARPTIKGILDTEALNSEYINIVNFLQSITLKSKLEKEDFFKGVVKRMKDSCISSELIARRLAPLFLSPLILAEQTALNHIIKPLLTPLPMRREPNEIGLIECDLFARYIIPVISDLLSFRILHVRMAIIRNIKPFLHLFEKSVLTDVILPEILIGLRDENNDLVRESLHALAEAIPIVGGDVIVGEEREKIFSFGLPKVNGSILLDASSLANQIKPKRIPKRPTKAAGKKKFSDKPKTLLEMAMTNQTAVKPSRETLKQKQEKFAKELKNKAYIIRTENDSLDEILNEGSITLSNGHHHVDVEPKTNCRSPITANDSLPTDTAPHDQLQIQQEHIPIVMETIQNHTSNDKTDGFDQEENASNKKLNNELHVDDVVISNSELSGGKEEEEHENEEGNNGWDVGDEDWDEFDVEDDNLGGAEDKIETSINQENKLLKPLSPEHLSSFQNEYKVTKNNIDINLGSEFEVKVQKKRQESVDFFQDMVP